MSLELPGGESVVCWWYHDDSLGEAAPAILYLHGNGENLETMSRSGFFNRLANIKTNFLALDYPGYGRSTGVPSERTVALACDSALIWMRNRYPRSRIVVCGWSLGAAAAISASSRNDKLVDGLVALSAWTSLADVAAQFYPRFLVRLLVRDRYESIEAIKGIRMPILLIHGKNDRLIPIEQAEKLVAASRATKRWVPLAQTEHNDLLDNQIVWAEIRNFLRSFTPKPAARP